MEHWEFLLQKEGDRSWLPLDSPDVEILEGRYRIVARSSNSNAAIDTRITHIATAEVPPKRRVQKRSCHTNQDGLMVVIPFTRLEPGLWELQCSSSDLLTDLMTGAQPHAVTLQVVAREADEDWDLDWTSPAEAPAAPAVPRAENVSATTNRVEVQDAFADNTLTEPTLRSPTSEGLSASNDRPIPLPPEVAEILGASMDRLFQIAEQMSEQLVDEVMQDLDLTAIADAPTPINTAQSGNGHFDRADTSVSSIAASATDIPHHHADGSPIEDYALADGEAFSLTLNQTAFVSARGEVLTLSGVVAIVPGAAVPASNDTTTSRPEPDPDAAGDGWESETALNLRGATGQELQLCLRDPQSLQILVSDRQSLSLSAFPIAFTFSFSLPETFSTHLVLGEVLLCGSLPSQPEAAIALTTQAFSITVDPTALMGELTKLHEALTTEIADEERLDLPLELSARVKEQAAAPLDLSFLNVAVVEPSGEQAPRFPSLAGQPLPPQLYRPDPMQASAKSLDLPAFKLTPPLEPTTATQPERVTPDRSTAEAIAPTTAAAATNGVDAPEGMQATPDNLVAADAIDRTPATPADAIVAVTPDQASTNSDKTSATDQALDLPSPMHMAFQSLKLQDRFLTRLTSLATDSELSALLKANLAPGRMPFGAATAPSAADARSLTEEIVVDDEPQPNERRHSSPKPTLEAVPNEPPNPLILPADDPVPTPTLAVTTGELISGQVINVRVQLPNLLPRIYVKLWITDRQTRSLLDGPRWLVDFLPNGLNALEAITPLTVPFGSVEIRLEAIAVEMHTQRESHKVTVDRVVVPPNLPSVSLDDFNE